MNEKETRMINGRISEEDLARVVVEHFRANGWTVYQEVMFGRYDGRRADLVADRDGELHVVEVKTSLSSRLIAQARFWQMRAEYTSIAIPAPVRKTKSHARRICDVISMGLGVLYVNGDVQVAAVPKKMESAWSDRLRKFLREEQKDYAPAGNACSDFVSGFKLTCNALRGVVAAEPGILLTEAIKRIIHHYYDDRTASSAMLQWIYRDKVPGVTCEKEKGRIRLYPKD